jgi:hypothetical protein
VELDRLDQAIMLAMVVLAFRYPHFHNLVSRDILLVVELVLVEMVI